MSNNQPPKAITRPLMRYHGGKFRLAPKILALFPPHRTYLEPFGGGASVLLRKRRSQAEVYNDLDGDVVNLFRMARDQGEDLLRAIALTPFSREEYAAAWDPASDNLERARRLLIRSWMGHGSSGATRSTRLGKPGTGFRSIVQGRGTHSAMDWRRLPGALGAVLDRLQGVVIENRDAFHLLPRYDGDDSLFYVDPPYLHSTRDDNRADYRHELDEPGHVALAAALRSCRARILVSGYACPLYEELYAGWHRLEFAATADGGAPRLEILWLNYLPAQQTLL